MKIGSGRMGLCTASGKKGAQEKITVGEPIKELCELKGAMDAGCCVGDQHVLQSEKMPYATLRRAKSSEEAKEKQS